MTDESKKPDVSQETPRKKANRGRALTAAQIKEMENRELTPKEKERKPAELGGKKRPFLERHHVKGTLRWDSTPIRKDFWKDLCEHLEAGYSLNSYPHASEMTIYKYATDFPEDCPVSALEEALRHGRKMWEKIGLGGATGKINKFSAAAWIFNMKCRYGMVEKIEVSGPNGGAITQAVVTAAVSEDRIKELIKEVNEEF